MSANKFLQLTSLDFRKYISLFDFEAKSYDMFKNSLLLKEKLTKAMFDRK